MFFHTQSAKPIKAMDGRASTGTEKGPDITSTVTDEVMEEDIKFVEMKHASADQEDELCEYEKLRLRNIARNNARLAELGLLTNISDVTLSSGRSKERQSKRRKISGNAASHSKTTTIATRRSTRLRKSAVPSTESTNDRDLEAVICDVLHDAEATDQVYEVADEYQVSPLVEYMMTDVTSTKQQISETSSSNNYDGAVTSLNLCAARLNPPQGLDAIYSLQFYPNYQNTLSMLRNSWLVGAGKSGIVSLWNTRSGDLTCHTENIDPMLSWKAHSGRWISDALFLPATLSLSSSSNCASSSPQRLITAANDGCVCIWNLTKVSVQSGAPKLLFKSGKELHSSGIFSMDVKSSMSNSLESQDILIATGSKDKTVALSTLESLEHNSNPIWRSNYHSRKVGAVQLNPSRASNLIASAADDGLVGVHDFRKKSIAAELKDAHEKPHSVVWDPSEEHLLMTAGLDPVIKLWDIRKMKAPLSSYHSHVPLCTTRCKRIHSPAFYHPGLPSEKRRDSFILTGGEGSHSLSMFQQQQPFNSTSCNETEHHTTVFSRGKLPSECGDVGRIAVDNDHIAAAVGGGEILLLKPKSN